MNSQKKFSDALKEWRKKKDLSQQEVAQRIGISRTIISFLENGQQQPQVHHIKLFQDNFGVDFSDTIIGSEEMDRPYFHGPEENQSTATAMALMINSAHEVKKDLVIARSLLQEIITMGDEIERELMKRIKIIYSICDQALMKL